MVKGREQAVSSSWKGCATLQQATGCAGKTLDWEDISQNSDLCSARWIANAAVFPRCSTKITALRNIAMGMGTLDAVLLNLQDEKEVLA